MTDATDTMEGGKGLLICKGYDYGYYFFKDYLRIVEVYCIVLTVVKLKIKLHIDTTYKFYLI